MAMLGEINGLLGEAVRGLLPDHPLTSLLADHALFALTILSGLVVILFLTLSLFFDFVTDAWKLPFAIVVDALKYAGFVTVNEWLLLAAGVCGPLIFLFLSDAGWARWPFALIVFTAPVLVFLLAWSPLGVLIAIAPINTILMFIATILD